MRWFTSDIHLFHNLIHKKYRSHCATLEDMHHEFVIQWNKQVKSKDIVYVLGDVSFGKWEETKEILSKLNGRKILIRGNHDERFTSAHWVALGFEDVRDIFVFKKSSETGKPAQKWILCHYPYSSPFRYFFYRLFGKFLGRRSEAGYYKLYLSYKGHPLIHGHHHSGPTHKYDQLNVAWDIHRRLLSENEVRDMLTEHKSRTNVLQKLKAILW